MHSGILSLSRHVFCLIALLWAVSGFAADVPRETLERMAEVNVGLAEIGQLKSIGKLTAAEYNQRKKNLDAEQRTLWEPHHLVSQITPQEMQAAQTTLIGLTRTKLSLLEPRWAKEQAEFQEAGRRQHEQTAAAVEKDARTAADFQRQRLLLQRQLDKGTIDRDSFAAKDKEAQDGIAVLRKKFEDAGSGWPRRFDDRLTLLTQALADNPDTVLPRPQVPATVEGQRTDKGTDKGAGRGGDPDFDSDVKRAAEMLVKYDENRWKVTKKEGNPASYTASSVSYSRELSRLQARYQALNQLQQFEAAYTRMAAPGLQALKLKYQPEAYRPPVTYQPPPPEKDYTLWYWIGGGLLLVIVLGALGFGQEEKQAPPKPQTSGIHGTADWAAHEQRPTTHTNVTGGVTFGKSSQPGLDPDLPGAPITSQPENHTLIIAQTGAGKGTRVIIPTLLRYSSSMLVIDPKGENAAVTARARKKLGQQIQILNPWGVMKDHYKTLGFETATFNPLDVLDRDDPNAVSIAQSLASTICPTTNPKEGFWQGSAADILAGVMLWLTDNPLEQKTLARVREIVTLPPKDFRKIIAQMLACSAFHGAVRQAVGQASDTSAADTYGGIMYNLQRSTAFISDSQIKTSTSTSSLSMKNLSSGKLTVYVVIPFKLIKTHSTWLRLVITAGMQSLITSRENPSGKLNRCMFLIDEFGSIGHIANIASDLAQMRGYGMDFTLILQGLNQLKEHYGDARDSIIGTCRYKYFCDVADLESAKWLSDTLGKKTVQTVSTSTSQGATQAGQTEGSSTSYGETGRALLTPDEIMHLGKNTAILLNPDTRPHYLHPVDYWKLKSAYKHLENSRHKTYWEPSLSYDRNPAVPNSTAVETISSEESFEWVKKMTGEWPPGPFKFPPTKWDQKKKE